ncbi:MAG: OmpA family protein [Alphaproteobacteria bacterium]|nr:OmpA family protein [Alphaproteobacteria bacterium]
MVLGLAGNRKALCRFAVLALLGTSLSACSALPGWVDPTSWFGPDLPSAQSDNGQTPDLANMPARPQAGSSAAENRAVAHSLVAARQQVQYSADQLRGGTEPAAPPPDGSNAPTSLMASANANTAAQEVTTSQMPPAQATGTAATTSGGATSAGTATPASGAAPTVGPTPAAGPAPSSGAAPSAGPAPAAGPAPDATQSTPAADEGAAPNAEAAALPAVPQAQAPGFAPSKAPPLEPSVANYVPPQIMSRYAQSAATAGANGAPEQTAPVVAALTPQSTPNLSSLLSGSTPVQFVRGGTVLTPRARKAVIAFAKAFVGQGGQGYVQVVGYGGPSRASVGTIETNFARAQTRARKVADLLIRSGVPAAKILIAAHGQMPVGQTALAVISLK